MIFLSLDFVESNLKSNHKFYFKNDYRFKSSKFDLDYDFKIIKSNQKIIQYSDPTRHIG